MLAGRWHVRLWQLPDRVGESRQFGRGGGVTEERRGTMSHDASSSRQVWGGRRQFRLVGETGGRGVKTPSTLKEVHQEEEEVYWSDGALMVIGHGFCGSGASPVKK